MPSLLYPFLLAMPLQQVASLTSWANASDRKRGAIMERGQFGLTNLYNRLHGPGDATDGIAELRAIQERIDAAVLDAYGWSDIECDYDFRDATWLPEQGQTRFAMSLDARGQVLERLAQLNGDRAG